MDLRNSNGTAFRNFTLQHTAVWKLFSKLFTRSGKLHHMGLNLGTSKSVSENPSTRLKILTCESSMQSYIKFE